MSSRQRGPEVPSNHLPGEGRPTLGKLCLMPPSPPPLPLCAGLPEQGDGPHPGGAVPCPFLTTRGHLQGCRHHPHATQAWQAQLQRS